MTTPASLSFQLTYASVPFISDAPEPIPSPEPMPEAVRMFVEMDSGDIYTEIERKIPFVFLTEYVLPSQYPGRNCGAIAYPWQTGPLPSPEVRIGVYYYPNSASRWSVFRGLMTSSMYKAVRAATNNLSQPATFTMKQVPDSPGFANTTANFTISTSMYMLPGRCLAETAGQDGLYLVTLVDERYWWQYNPANLRPIPGTTWNKFITQLGESLGVTINVGSIPAAYNTPEMDSQFWCNQESAALLLDAVAFNIGTNLVRNLNGTYTLQTPLSSQATVNSNRGNAAQLVRLAGGDMFASGSPVLPTGRLDTARNAVLTPSINVTFPKYIAGDDPVPHYFNPRYIPTRPSAHYEESYGDTYVVNVPLASGGTQFAGLVGVIPSSGTSVITHSGVDFASGYSHCIHDTAKALYSGEVQIGFNAAPINNSGLTALAMQLAQDYWNGQVASALDEVYPGTFVWTPEGIHDIIWTYSDKKGIANCRVLRAEWNQIIREMQHATPPLPNQTANMRGAGGQSVAQTWRDSLTGGPSTTAVATVNSGDSSISPASTSGFPTDRRWVATINSGQADQEFALCEGLSGGTVFNTFYRGYWGSIQQNHTAGAVVQQFLPNTVYGANLVRAASGLQIAPGLHTSGGIQEAVIYPVSGAGGGGAGSGSVGSGSIASGAVNSGNISSGAINVFNLGVFSWPITVNPINVTSLQVTGGGSFTYGGTNIGVVLNNSPELFFSTNTAGTIVDGFAGGINGQLLYLVNYGAAAIQFNHLAAAEAAGNKIQFPLASNFLLYTNREMVLQYDGTNNVWRPIWVTGAGVSNGPVTYGCDWIKQGSGLVSTDGGDGSNTFSIGSGLIQSYMIGSGAVASGALASGAIVPGTATSLFHFTGVSTDGGTVLLILSGALGLHGSFSVRNSSGSNSLSAPFSLTDFYGVIGSGSINGLGPDAAVSKIIDSLGAGANLTSGTAPYQSFVLAAKSSAAGNPTGYDIYVSICG